MNGTHVIKSSVGLCLFLLTLHHIYQAVGAKCGGFLDCIMFCRDGCFDSECSDDVCGGLGARYEASVCRRGF